MSRASTAATTSASAPTACYYRVTTDASLAALLENRPVVLERPLHFIIGPDETLQESPESLAREFLGATLGYWQEWVRTLAVPADWQDAVIRAAITLKLCTYEDTGAVLAALTTSIPEAANSTRNWDYRYCWLRDSYFVIQTLNRLGATRTMEAYLHFIDHIIASSTADTLQPLYGITGDRARRREDRHDARRVIAAWDRCASATWPPTRCSTTSTAR